MYHVSNVLINILINKNLIINTGQKIFNFTFFFFKHIKLLQIYHDFKIFFTALFVACTECFILYRFYYSDDNFVILHRKKFFFSSTIYFRTFYNLKKKIFKNKKQLLHIYYIIISLNHILVFSIKRLKSLSYYTYAKIYGIFKINYSLLRYFRQLLFYSLINI